MDFKFKAKLFKSDPARNVNNNPKYPKYGGTIEMPLSKLQDLVEYLHWAAKTDLKYDDFLKDHVVPVKISGWNGGNENRTWVDLTFEPGYTTKIAAQEAKQASELASSEPTAESSAANLAEATAGAVVDPPKEDLF